MREGPVGSNMGAKGQYRPHVDCMVHSIGPHIGCRVHSIGPHDYYHDCLELMKLETQELDNVAATPTQIADMEPFVDGSRYYH